MATKIRLGSADAALVFRKDGTLDALIPSFALSGDAPENVLVAQALLWASCNDRIMDSIAEAIEAEDHPPDA